MSSSSIEDGEISNIFTSNTSLQTALDTDFISRDSGVYTSTPIISKTLPKIKGMKTKNTGIKRNIITNIGASSSNMNQNVQQQIEEGGIEFPRLVIPDLELTEDQQDVLEQYKQTVEQHSQLIRERELELNQQQNLTILNQQRTLDDQRRALAQNYAQTNLHTNDISINSNISDGRNRVSGNNT